MVDTCHVTGTLIAPDGSPLPRVAALFHRLPERAFVAGDSTGMPHVVRQVTCVTGTVSVHLVPGAYMVRPQGASYPAFRIDVPDEPTANLADIQDDILQPPPSQIIEAVDAAKEARDEAVGAKDAAEEAADRAEAARAAARTIFPDTAAGLAATTDGDYFSVPSDDSDDYLILYRNVSGSAQEISRAPSLEAVETLIGQATVSLDFNAIETSGFYSASNTAGETENTPEGLGQIGLFHIEGSNNRRHQLAFRMSTSEPTMWVRAHFQSSGWGEWRELAFRDSVEALEVAVDPLVGEASLSTNWDVIEKSGFYRGADTSGGTQGAPVDNPFLGLLHIQKNNGAAHQLAFRQSSTEPQMWFRARLSAGWSPWKEISALRGTHTAQMSLDWDSINESGFYQASNSAGETVGVPEDRPFLGLFHLQKERDRAHQLAFRQSSAEPQMWVRARLDSAWRPWKEIAMMRGTHIAELSLDFDSIDESGFYRSSDNVGETAGVPEDRPFLGLLHIHKPNRRHHQMAFRQNTDDPQIWVRSQNTLGDWGDWKEIARKDHVAELLPDGEFYTGDEDLEIAFALADENGGVLLAWDTDGNQIVGGGSVDFSTIPTTEQEVPERGVWNDKGSVSVRPALLAVNKTNTRTLFPTTSAVHQYLDDLVAEFPDYLSVEKIGEDRLGNDINAYRAKPPRYVQVNQGLSYPESQVLKPKIILVSGTHGNEIHCVSANIILLEEICREWRTIERLDQYRWGLDLILVPVANPSGYDANTRDTSAGVNLNRNFPTRWSSSAESGASPASEPETQALIALMEAHEDAIGLIDHHRMFQHQADGERLVWVATEGSGNVGLGLNAVNVSVAEVKRRFPFVPQANEPVGAISAHFDGALGLHADALGIPGFMLETPNAVSGNNSHVYTHARRCLDNLIWEIFQKELRQRSVEYIL